MNHRMLTNVAVLLSSCVAFTVLGAAGCYAPAVEEDAESAERGAEIDDLAEGAGEEEAGEASEDVGEAQEALLACAPTWHHGGNLWEQTYDKVMGCACGDGYIKSSYKVWNSGHGNCWALGWVSSDPKDCRVNVRIKDSGGFFYGDCHLEVQSTLNPAASCVNRCGQRAPDGCYCDAECSRFGDCCPNYDAAC
ncbi:hypothetical protein WMF31_17405 [Sorangium sp. So ce1036]|uniref:hypothetical protein n=1 Tax=Sorangium sp. So ce1036 TaxID=3133328 RepID=UPI003F0ADC06